MSTVTSNPTLNPSRPSKIQVEVKHVARTVSAQATAAPLNVDADGGD
ncbi:MAG: hypothetical protein ACFBSC_21720 [Microcoleaceae cyanobacterium]